jgi:hypothetical protein
MEAAAAEVEVDPVDVLVAGFELVGLTRSALLGGGNVVGREGVFAVAVGVEMVTLGTPTDAGL